MADLALMPDGKDEDGVVLFLKAVQGDVAGAAAGYHEFPEAVLRGTAAPWARLAL